MSRRLAVCLWLVALIVVFSTGCSNSTAETSATKDSRETSGLHGNVKAYTLYTVVPLERLGMVFDAGASPVYSHNFSMTGDRVESVYYDGWGLPVMNEKLTYEADKIVTCVRYKYNDDGSSTTETGGYTNVYGDDDNIDYIRGYYYHEQQDRVDWLHLYEYLDDGQKTVISSFYHTDPFFTELQWKHVHKYRNNRLVEVQHYNKDGSIAWIDKFKYDSKGNQTEWARFSSRTRLEWIETTKFDDNGNEIERIRRDSNNHLIYKYVFRYVTVPAIDLSNDDEITDSLFLTEGYNPNRPGGPNNSFDPAGNWTEKVTLEENTDFNYTFLEVIEIQKREFTYYK
jgi:hypothetical protein